MGNNQILLIVLGVIIVGIAVASGILYMNYQLKQNHKQEIIAMINYFMLQGMEYRRTPLTYGGGEGSFVGFTPANAVSSDHVSGNSPGAVKLQFNSVNYFIEWYFNDRLKIIASSLVYGQGHPWPNTYNARITAVFDKHGAIDKKGFEITGDW